jgi:hypothetical protein
MPVTTTVSLDLDGSGAFATDISPYLLEASVRQGRTKSLDPMEPATATVKLNNADGRFSPDNAGGDYYPDFDDNGVGIRIEAGTRRFTGVITQIVQDPFIENQEVVLTCTDRLGLLAGQTVSCGLFRQQPLYLVLNRVLDCLEAGEEITNPGAEGGVTTGYSASAGGGTISATNTTSFEGDWCIQAICDGTAALQGIRYDLGAAVTTNKKVAIFARLAEGDPATVFRFRGLTAAGAVAWTTFIYLYDDRWTYLSTNGRTGHRYIELCTYTAAAVTILADCLHQVPNASIIARSVPTTLDAEVELFGLYEAPALENLNRLMATEAGGFLYMKGFDSGYGTIYASSYDRRWEATASFGKTDIGDNWWIIYPDHKGACKYTSTGGIVGAIVWYGKAFTGTIKAKAMIYADSAGSPGALLATSEEVTGIGTTDAWHSFPFSTPVTLAAGDYWLGIIVDDGIAIYRYDPGDTDQTWVNDNTYGDGPSDPFGAGETKPDNAVSIYAVGIAATFGDDGVNTPYVGLSYGLDAKERISRAEVRSQGAYETTEEEATIWTLSPTGQLLLATESMVIHADYSQPARGCELVVAVPPTSFTLAQAADAGRLKKIGAGAPTPTTQIMVGMDLSGATVYRYRSYLRFDTSPIPDAVLTAAYLRVWVYQNYGKYPNTAFTIMVRDAPDWYELDATDWTKGDGEDALTAGTWSDTLPPVDQYIDIPIDVAGIDKEGFSEFRLASIREEGSETPTEPEYVQFWGFAGDKSPMLFVEYEGGAFAAAAMANYGVGAEITLEAGALDAIVPDVSITGYPFQACSEESVVVADAITPPIMPATLSVEMPCQGTRTPDMVAEATRLALRHSGKVRRLPLSLQEQDAASLAQMETRELDDLVRVINERFAFSTKINADFFIEGLQWIVTGQGKVLEIVFNLEEA